MNRVLPALMLAGGLACAQSPYVDTFGYTQIGTFNGTVRYDSLSGASGTSPQGNYAGGGKIKITNPSTLGLTSVFSQISSSLPGSFGLDRASASAAGDLSAGTFGAYASGTDFGSLDSVLAFATAKISDTLTFHVAGANDSTVTTIGVNYAINGIQSLGVFTNTYASVQGTLVFGGGNASVAYDTISRRRVIQSGWASQQIVSNTPPSFNFQGTYALTGATIVVPVFLELALDCHGSICDYSNGGAFSLSLPAGVTFTSASGAFLTHQISSAGQFVPVPPCRLVDTRIADGTFGGPTIDGGTSREFVLPLGSCLISPAVTAYSLNVAVVPRETLGFLTLWPAGQSQPQVATLNSPDGRIKSNAAIVPAGSNGAVRVFATDTTDVILDLTGYFVPKGSSGALAFYPVPPCRVADTRDATGPLGGPSLDAQSTRTFPILESSCQLPAYAKAYSMNLAAVPKGPLGFLTAWPAGAAQPVVASLNDPTGTVAANAVIVPAGANGAVDVFTSDATDLIIDINGYYAPPGPGGLSLYTVTPCRVVDTRLPEGAPPFIATLTVNVAASPCGIPNTANAFVFNATVIPPRPLGFITMWPQGQRQPVAATLNAIDGAVTNNMAIVPTTTGSVEVFPSDPTQLVLDIFGFFAP